MLHKRYGMVVVCVADSGRPGHFNKEVLVVILFSQITDDKRGFAYFLESLYNKIGIKECNVLIMLDKTPHTFHIPTIGILEDAPKPFEDLWDFIVKHDIQDEHTFAIELNPIINLFEGKISAGGTDDRAFGAQRLL